jgi:methyl-accepting chemotaxis protein
MNDQKNRRRWRNIVVRPGFQLRLALSHCVFVLAVVMVLVASLLSTFYLDVQGSNDLWARYASAELLWRIFGRFGLAILAILAISAIYYIVFSHRLCGPLVNIRHTAERVLAGDLTRKVFLRRTDFLKEEAAVINSMVTKLDERITFLKVNHADLLAAGRQVPEGPEKDRLYKLLKQQERLMEQWTTTLSDENGR